MILFELHIIHFPQHVELTDAYKITYLPPIPLLAPWWTIFEGVEGNATS